MATAPAIDGAVDGEGRAMRWDPGTRRARPAGPSRPAIAWSPGCPSPAGALRDWDDLFRSLACSAVPSDGRGTDRPPNRRGRLRPVSMSGDGAPAAPHGGMAGEPGDGDLVRAAQADPAAFAALYERYADPVYRYCLVRLGEPSDAEDAASAVFARAFRAVPSFRPRPDLPGEGVRSWLFTIAHHAVVNRYRDARPTAPEAAAGTLPDPDPPPDEQAIAAERRAVLRQAIGQLSDDQRRVVELRLAGLSGPEIAAATDRSHGSVKMLQSRAIARLRTLLGDRLADRRDGSPGPAVPGTRPGEGVARDI